MPVVQLDKLLFGPGAGFGTHSRRGTEKQQQTGEGDGEQAVQAEQKQVYNVRRLHKKFFWKKKKNFQIHELKPLLLLNDEKIEEASENEQKL